MLDRLRTTGLLRWGRELALIALVLYGVEAFQTRDHPRGPVPETVLRTLEGDFVRLSYYKGRRTLLAVWAPWCHVCALETGNIRRVRDWLAPSIRVVSIAAAYKSDKEVHEYVRDNHVDYPVLLADNAFSENFAVRSFPSFFVLDADGRIVSSAQGYTTTAGLWLRAKLGGFWR